MRDAHLEEKTWQKRFLLALVWQNSQSVAGPTSAEHGSTQCFRFGYQISDKTTRLHVCRQPADCVDLIDLTDDAVVASMDRQTDIAAAAARAATAKAQLFLNVCVSVVCC